MRTRKYDIKAIDLEVNEGKSIKFETAIKRIQDYILKNIDNTFPTDKFAEWYDDSTDEPFVWNKNKYFWS